MASPPLIDAISVSGSSSISGRSLGEEETRKMLERVEACVVADGDSDLELESEIPSIESFISWDVIRHLQPKEKRRQEVINELFYTERTHVRNLKILYRVFYTPLLVQQIVPPDVVKLLFSNIDEIVDIHCQISRFMRTAAVRWRNAASTNGLYGDIGDVMLSIFDGAMGHRLSEATSQFCQHQQYALEVLRLRCKKDESLVRFLAEVETNVLCRKLQLKDMLPVEMQRLVKYPILLETIGKYTADPSEEQTKIAVCVQHAKAILSSVNIAKRNTENLRRLQDLQRRLDTTSFDRDNANSPDYRGLDLTRYHLIHEGPLTWRFNRGKMVELHVVLLEQMLVLLTRQGGDGQRLQLRVQEPSKEVRWSPILPLGPLIAKEKANDRKAFFIVSNVAHGAQIYEFVAATATERKTWYKLISDQIDIVHRKAGGNSTASMSELGLPSDLTAGSLRHVASAPNCEDPTALGGEEQRVQVLTHPRLVNADEIRVLQPTILEHAQPILTPPERLRRADHLISTALLEKQTILASFLPPDLQAIHMADLDQLAEQLIGLSLAELKQKDSRELIVATIVHGNRLLDAINQAMNNREVSGESLPSVPCYRLTGIAAPLMNHLKAVMQVVQDQHGQMNEMRQQLHHYKELVDTGSSSIRSVSEETLTDTGQQRGSQQGMVNTGQQQGSQQAMVNTGQQRASQQAMENEEEQRRKQRLQQKRARNSVRVLGAGDDNPS